VVINDLDVGGVTILPSETDPPLVINQDPALTAPAAFELLQPVTGWDTQIFERFCRVQDDQFSQHDVKQLGWKPPHWLTVKQALSVAIGEVLDHPLT
jgi:hypothetical protein